ncbi:MAG: bifunctional riboflavin kinase/FAD synthetase [Candidatus Cloacimonadota bacterium]|nr:MAG: bifunctional riboflavin kinase/FAD synthetase [Candidatus Cloacimonadota bacterium]
MKYFQNQRCDFRYPVVSMGTFDGVHLGHRKLLKSLRKRADETGGEAVVITYYHHPLEIIHKKTFPYLLTERHKKEELIKNLGIDCVLYLNFDEKMAEMTADEFLTEILLGELETREFVVGYDTHFGKKREGNSEFLEKNAEKFHYRVETVEPLKIDNRIVSSSLIRDFVREGNMQSVERFLGRKYSLFGKVVSGKKIGRKIGFPTINVEPSDPNKLIPAIGVYISEATIEKQKYIAVTNIGYSPTLKRTNIKEIETFILDFEGEVYDKEVEIIFHRRLRDEVLFPSENDLIKAIFKDVEQTRRYFQK